MRYSEFASKKPHEFLLFTNKNGEPEIIDKDEYNTMKYTEFANALTVEPLLFPKKGKSHIISGDQDNYLDDDEFLEHLTVDELKKLLIRNFIEHKN
jgi:hypothetical protein